MVGLSQGHAVFCIVMGYDDDHDDHDNINTKITCYFLESFPKCVNPPTPGFLRDLGKQKVKVWSFPPPKKRFLNLPLPENSHSPSS